MPCSNPKRFSFYYKVEGRTCVLLFKCSIVLLFKCSMLRVQGSMLRVQGSKGTGTELVEVSRFNASRSYFDRLSIRCLCSKCRTLSEAEVRLFKCSMLRVQGSKGVACSNVLLFACSNVRLFKCSLVQLLRVQGSKGTGTELVEVSRFNASRSYFDRLCIRASRSRFVCSNPEQSFPKFGTLEKFIL